MVTLGQLRTRVLSRLGDLEQVVWTATEVDGHLRTAYDAVAALNVFFDTAYLEDRPRSFSYTAPWEQKAAYVAFDAGCANYTASDELRAAGDELDRIGPANHTSPFEATEGWLALAGADTRVPATSVMPSNTVALDRATWDSKVLGQALPAELARTDTSYESTRGPVEVLCWSGAGLGTVRKWRIPSGQADAVTVDGGPWGILRRPADLSAAAITGSWGICRRLPGHHPLTAAVGPGPGDYFGHPRRAILDGRNTRVEFFRRGRPIVQTADVCELPDRYAWYLTDFALMQCLQKAGPGFDATLAGLFAQRWARHLARVQRRVLHVSRERVGVLGGAPRVLGSRPARTQLPYTFGERLR